MSKIIEMRDKRAKAWDAAKAFLDSKEGTMGAEDEATYQKMENEVVALGKEIERFETRERIDAEMKAPTSTPITNNPAQGSNNPQKPRATAEYRENFVGFVRGRGVQNVLSEGIDADGGYLVPETLDNEIQLLLDNENIIRSVAKVITTESKHKIPIVTQNSKASWVGENKPIPSSGTKFGQKELDAHKATDLIIVSIELLQDAAFDIEAYLAEEFARAIGALEEEAFAVGTGIGQPTGIFHATEGGAVGTTLASPTAITFDNMFDLKSSLKTAYRKNAGFMANDTTLSSLRKIKDNNGQYIWQPAIKDGEIDRLLGYPVKTTDYAPSIAAGNTPIAFGDFKNYWIGDRSGRTIQRLVEKYAEDGQVGFLAMQRVDGRVVRPEGIKLLKMGA